MRCNRAKYEYRRERNIGMGINDNKMKPSYNRPKSMKSEGIIYESRFTSFPWIYPWKDVKD